ncbi:putative cell wall glucanase (Scw4) [Aspergillus thermomutatus]|uniref:Uncharacterized protein n=1 Tax=Aspergillus thermomutatus TaxID=41047 RepID=A0A397H8P9_ASPTH|nr:uncharacterized protein CDV56_100269 [Aspergillus thermomutatus]RHZ58064.1 hypothetical protein CDV56_100269 [Aspergillus thermomutatus]
MRFKINLLALLLAYQSAAHPHDTLSVGYRRDAEHDINPHEQVIVWVDQAGHTISIEHNHQTPTTASKNSPTELPLLPDTDDVLPDNLLPKLPIKVPNLNMHSDPRFGISYSPYTSYGTCKSFDQINKDIEHLSYYSFIRIYGIDCDQTKLVTQAARQHGLKVFAGVFDLQNFPDSLHYIRDAAAAAGGDWSVFHTIAIGNELVNKGQNAPGDVVNAVNTARGILRGAGYQGPVVTVDTFSVMLQHPELCTASDYCAANCHAFFDNQQLPEHAGEYALDKARRISVAAGGKKTVITESGWPHAGLANGRAVPSPENQKKAIASLRRAFANDPDFVLFTAFDDLWKSDNPWTFGAERFWGIEG